MRIPISKLRMPKTRRNKAVCFTEFSSLLNCVSDHGENATDVRRACAGQLATLNLCLAGTKGVSKHKPPANYHIQRIAKKSQNSSIKTKRK